MKLSAAPPRGHQSRKVARHGDNSSAFLRPEAKAPTLPRMEPPLEAWNDWTTGKGGGSVPLARVRGTARSRSALSR
eukprot:17034-Chlamydomonas_euryale.AAC.1